MYPVSISKHFLCFALSLMGLIAYVAVVLLTIESYMKLKAVFSFSAFVRILSIVLSLFSIPLLFLRPT